jgi:hypothetical protein
VDWRVSPWRGGNGDDGSRKHARDRGGSVAGVDEMRARLAVGRGERESLVARSERRFTGGRWEKKSVGDGGGALFKWHDGEATEGDPAVRVPHGAIRPWGLAPTGGWRPDRVPDRDARGRHGSVRAGSAGGR